MMMLTDEERDSLTFWGDSISAQVRDKTLVVHVRESADRSTEDGNPVILSDGDINRFRELFDEACDRGIWD